MVVKRFFVYLLLLGLRFSFMPCCITLYLGRTCPLFKQHMRTFYSLKKLHAKKRKIVDRIASTSRNIRYNVYEKIVNFMAPETMAFSPMLPDLNNLFGLKKQKPAKK
ncbi:uncharacterized protein [Malus domestica]|uniref:uncharacterized protein isoform X3 n=1 Tax=Malus domestica TaxID=3750 RepID=UPI003976356E